MLTISGLGAITPGAFTRSGAPITPALTPEQSAQIAEKQHKLGVALTVGGVVGGLGLLTGIIVYVIRR